MTTEETTRLAKPARISRRMSLWLWRSAIALVCLIIVIAGVIAFRGRSLQTFVSKTDPKTGYRFRFQVSKRWQQQPPQAPSYPFSTGMLQAEGFHRAPPLGLEKWLDEWIYHSSPNASPGDFMFGIMILQNEVYFFSVNGDGYPYLKSNQGYTIVSDRRMMLSGGKAYFCHIRFAQGGSQYHIHILLVKANDKPLFCYLAGISDNEAHDRMMRSDFETIIQTFKIEKDAKAGKEGK